MVGREHVGRSTVTVDGGLISAAARMETGETTGWSSRRMVPPPRPALVLGVRPPFRRRSQHPKCGRGVLNQLTDVS